VLASVRFARDHDLLVSVRGGGHNVAGKAVADAALMIDLSAMRAVHVDPALATVRVAGGCLWSDVDRETQAFGLATTGGTVSHTGVGGLTLGGGIGWLAALHGLTCDNLVSVDLVTAGGEYLRASEREHAELFWALRGGGGNFGIATSFEFRAHPVGPTVYGGPLLWPASQAADILSAYLDLSSDASDELVLFAGLIPNPEDMQPMVAIVVGWFGPLEGAEVAVAPVRALQPVADLAGPLPYVALQSMLDDAVPHGLPRYWKSGYFTDFPAPAIESIVAANGEKPTPISLQLFFRQHGAATRVEVQDSAFPHRSPSWDFDALAQWTEPDQADAGVQWARGVWQELAPFSSGVYVNHLDGDDRGRISHAYGPNWDRLVGLKQKYDPDNFFRLNNNIAAD
jgi:FAD/FMN-containing dehydrogenase